MDDLWSQALQAQRSGDVAKTYALCEELLAQDPHNFGALNLMGLLALSVDQPSEALTFLDSALALFPDESSALVNRGAALHKLGLKEEAISAYRRAVLVDPSLVHGWYNLGTALKEYGALEEAGAALRSCIAVQGDYRAGHFNLANTLMELRHYDEAVFHYDRCVQLDPSEPEAYKNRSFAHLMMGRFEQGFEDFEYRWKTHPLDKAWRARGSPQWDGRQSLHGKAILVHAEQGLGDTLQFCRYLPMVKSLSAAQVVFEVQKPLLHLMRLVQGADVVIPQGLPLPQYDFHIPLMSLPRALGTTPASIPAPVPYLSAPRGSAERWANKLPADTYNIGICWQGSVKGIEVGKGIPLTAFRLLADLPHVRLFSLQKQGGEDDWRSAPEGMTVESFGPELDAEVPFADTAGVMCNLDLVVTTDTSVAHLAGGLGVPVWVALPYAADWRWGPAGCATAWYPTMRLFRQTQRGQWESCFQEIRTALECRLLSGSSA
jgi:tetratricopeptide (TPR) repeat protein